MRTDEYDGFGPWISEVVRPADIPSLYRDFPVDVEQALLILKVPRDIPRRDANAAMHLYDALIIVMSSTLTVLSRAGEGYTVRVVELAEIVAIEDTVLLLDGRLVIRITTGEPLEVAYNGSARGSITRLVTVLRRHALTTDAVATDAVATDAVTTEAGSVWGEATRRADIDTAIERVIPDRRDYGIRSDAVDVLRSEPGTIVLAGHSTTRVQPSRAMRLLEAFAHRVTPAFVQGAVVLGGSGDVSVLHRRRLLVRGSSDDLSRARTVLFTRRVEVVEVSRHELYDAVSIVRLIAGQGVVEFVVPDGSSIPNILAQSCINALRR